MLSHFLFVFALYVCSVTAADGEYNYDNPDMDWPKVNPICGGSRQSPINIVTDMVKDHTDYPEFMRMYRPLSESMDLTVSNNGKAITVGMASRGWLVSSSRFPATQHVLQVHHHSMSEHAINGKLFPLELHFVTAPYMSGDLSAATDLAVFGFLYEPDENDTPDPFLAAILEGGLPEKDAETTVNFVPYLEMGDTFYEYEGSLTTPPCWETVRWHVSTKIRSASAAQIQAFTDLRPGMPGNNRPVQPMFGRKVVEFKYTNGQMWKAYSEKMMQEGGDSSGSGGSCTGGGSGSPITINFGDTAKM